MNRYRDRGRWPHRLDPGVARGGGGFLGSLELLESETHLAASLQGPLIAPSIRPKAHDLPQ